MCLFIRPTFAGAFEWVRFRFRASPLFSRNRWSTGYKPRLSA